ncbi:MAG TPA: hypothetical protein VK607_03495, partial [Kofleriaceae bacterium]|nr:hypothetical protein [Kofleriaceae bacterium]
VVAGGVLIGAISTLTGGGTPTGAPVLGGTTTIGGKRSDPPIADVAPETTGRNGDATTTDFTPETRACNGDRGAADFTPETRACSGDAADGRLTCFRTGLAIDVPLSAPFVIAAIARSRLRVAMPVSIRRR